MAPLKSTAPAAPVEHLSWLGDVREVTHPLDHTHPIWVREKHIPTGQPVPSPAIPYPESHPYCEIHFNFQGSSTQYLGGENHRRRSGDLLLVPPGLPHYGVHLNYPQHNVAAYFLPSVVFEMGPVEDGARILRRFTEYQSIDRQIVTLPPKLRKEYETLFRELAAEFAQRQIGRELRLRSLLGDIFATLLRWEGTSEKENQGDSLNWVQIQKSLHYLHEHFREPLYVSDVARAAGLSTERFQTLFRAALGMSCIQYLLSYRISHAAAALCQPGARVTEIALETGFETLSHFNTSFRRLMGRSPMEYAQRPKGYS